MGLLAPAFFMQCQLQTNWCWAAVTAAVKQYPPPTPVLRQCDVATAMLRGGRCCPAENSCDRPFSLRTALTEHGKLKEFLPGQISFSDIQRQIDVFKQPVCARIGWDSDGDGFATTFHFVVIVGWRVLPTGVQYVYVMDPDIGITASEVNDVAFEVFRTQYRTYGTWLFTYIVK